MVSNHFKGECNPQFRSQLAEDIFCQKYRHDGCETWDDLARTLVIDVDNQELLARDERDQLIEYIRDMKFIPGGRYLYYAGRSLKYFNNCYLLSAQEDTREDWANLSWKAESCLVTGGGIGADYSVYREEGATIRKTGGTASGPLSAMKKINEIGRQVMQGGSRRSAMYASLNHAHPDIHNFLVAKNWDQMQVPGTNQSLWDVRQLDYNFPVPLDMTNISVNYDTAWLEKFYRTGDVGSTFMKECRTGFTNW